MQFACYERKVLFRLLSTMHKLIQIELDSIQIAIVKTVLFMNNTEYFNCQTFCHFTLK